MCLFIITCHLKHACYRDYVVINIFKIITKFVFGHTSYSLFYTLAMLTDLNYSCRCKIILDINILISMYKRNFNLTCYFSMQLEKCITM